MTAFALAISTAIVASGTTAGASTTKITSVTFGGTPSAPTLTIRGAGFGTLPSASPSGEPYKYLPGCTSQPPIGTKQDGRDYGAQGLSIQWGKVSAGAYVSGPGGYLDCVGLIVTKYTPSEIVIKPGCQYPYYAKMKNGTTLTVVVAHRRAIATIRFT